MDDFIVPDDSDEEGVRAPAKRKRSAPKQSSKSSSPPAALQSDNDDDFLAGLPSASTAQQWTYDPENPDRINEKPAEVAKNYSNKAAKQKAHKTEPEKRHTWLANPL